MWTDLQLSAFQNSFSNFLQLSEVIIQIFYFRFWTIENWWEYINRDDQGKKKSDEWGIIYGLICHGVVRSRDSPCSEQLADFLSEGMVKERGRYLSWQQDLVGVIGPQQITAAARPSSSCSSSFRAD